MKDLPYLLPESTVRYHLGIYARDADICLRSIHRPEERAVLIKILNEVIKFEAEQELLVTDVRRKIEQALHPTDTAVTDTQ